MSWWVYELYAQGEIALLLSWIFWVLLSITLHELGHGWAAIWQGDDTPIRLGRMTLNPVVHMGYMALIMFAICGITWGVMPVDPSRFRWRRKGRIVVWGAGPAMNVLIALVLLTASALWTQYGPTSNTKLYDNVGIFLITGGWLNVFLALFNLLPVPPLDGAGILAGISMRWYRWYNDPQVQQIGTFILIAIFISGIGWILQAAAVKVAHQYTDLLMNLLP